MCCRMSVVVALRLAYCVEHFAFVCTYRLVKTVDDINEQLDELKYEAEEVLCSSSLTT